MRPTIRSQFACTYKDADLPLNRVLDFPSSSQIPTCVHPAPKRNLAVSASDEIDPTGMDNGLAGIEKCMTLQIFTFKLMFCLAK